MMPIQFRFRNNLENKIMKSDNGFLIRLQSLCWYENSPVCNLCTFSIIHIKKFGFK